MRRLLHDERGQASVELVGMLWWMLLAALIVWQLCLAAWSVDQAANINGAAHGIAGEVFAGQVDRLSYQLRAAFEDAERRAADVLRRYSGQSPVTHREMEGECAVLVSGWAEELVLKVASPGARVG